MFEMEVAGAVTITMIERRSSHLAWIESNFGWSFVGAESIRRFCAIQGSNSTTDSSMARISVLY